MKNSSGLISELHSYEKNITLLFFGCLVVLFTFSACNKDVGSNQPPPDPDPVVPATLKDATSLKLGVAVDYDPLLNNNSYTQVVKREFDAVTFGYHMKHGAIVQNDGSLDFSRADAMVQALGPMEVFGHTLAWHANQNAAYLRSVTGITGPDGKELITNGGFENGNTGWSILNTNGASITFFQGEEAPNGTGAMRVENRGDNPGSPWKVQVASDYFPTTVNKTYQASVSIKADVADGSIRLSTQNENAGGEQYQQDQATGQALQKITWTFTANNAKTRLLLDMGLKAATYIVDDVSVQQIGTKEAGPGAYAEASKALETWITGMVNHYKGKVREWDVLNEPIGPNGAFRNAQNSTDLQPAADHFFWSDILGRDYAYLPFVFAKAADPAARLFINDFGLESSVVKTDSLVALVHELKGRGAKIDGIGTQMHITVNTSRNGIDNMFRKLAATGLLVRISELDVRVNPSNTAGFTFNAAVAANQAAMYRAVVQSYMQNVPEAQRAGITIWGVNDETSWLYNNGLDFPLLFDNAFQKKSAYEALLLALQGK